jgi:Na+/proline symporter
MISNSLHWLDYGVIAIYMLAVLGIGIYFSRNEKDSSDFLLGGRSMSYLAIGLSCMMSLLSSISIVMVPGEIYNHGLTLFSLTATLSVVLSIPFFLIFMKFYFKLGSFTPYEYLEYRYGKSVRGIIAISSLYIRTMYVGMVLYSSSKVFEGAFGWPVWGTILAVGVIGVVYTAMGGMKAVVWTDVMQFFVLCLGFIVIVVVLCNKIGGAREAIAYALDDC